MSYLLTEIALEMLGYKFYDIYGVPNEVNNFRHQVNTEQTPEINNEVHLAHLLGVNVDTEKTRKIHGSSELLEDINASLPESLSKLVDNEYNKVRKQILLNKQTLVNDYNKNPGVMQSFNTTEHEKLRMELLNLRNFRKIVEQKLLQINPATFEKYCQTFKPARKHIKRFDAIKK